MAQAEAARMHPAAQRRPREPLLAQIASFVDLFIWLLVLKSFFLPLFIIPTGSMAETLSGAHADLTCTNCGYDYSVGINNNSRPAQIQCPNCRWLGDSAARLASKAGDRIVVHGWTYDLGGAFAPQRWDVVVFKNPNDPHVNYIKRMVGLPGEQIEIIDGDVYVAAGGSKASIVPKTRHAQSSLWLHFFDQDYLPRDRSRYNPRWVAVGEAGAWRGLDTRILQFDGLAADRQTLSFTNQERGGALLVADHYGYNGPLPENAVTDIRLRAHVLFEEGEGAVEFMVSKDEHRFFARWQADGRLTLEHVSGRSNERTVWAETRSFDAPRTRPAALAIGHADGRVVVEVNGREALVSQAEQYTVTPEVARTKANTRDRFVSAQVSAERARVQLSHIAIDRDVHYTDAFRHQEMPPGFVPPEGRLAEYRKLSDRDAWVRVLPGLGRQGFPIQLDSDEYFVLGDNSPQSADSRMWGESELGPHLRPRLASGDYHLGTVPADQLMGRAFLVYWPGFLPLGPSRVTVLPDTGRIRWIH